MATTNSHTNSEINRITITDGTGNVIGIDAQQVNVSVPANITIPGGVSGDVVTTDGTGNIYWASTEAGTLVASELVDGNSNVTVSENSSITFASGGVANVMVVSGTGMEINANTVLPAIGNVNITGNIKGSVLFSNGQGGLRWGGDFLLPETGTSLGWIVANGLRLYRSGVGTSGQVASWRSGTTTWRPQSVPIAGLSGTESWAKIHMNQSALYALDDKGRLFSQGVDDNGQQGNTTTNVTNEVLTPITHSTIFGAGITVLNFWSYTDTTGINITDGAVMVNVDDNGTKKTYMFGNNNTGVLGNGTASTSNQVPTLITQLNGKTIISVSFFPNSILVATSDGQVWGCGSNTTGQLGLGTTVSVSTFSRATKSDGSFFTNAVSVTINYSATPGAFVVCSDGTLWAAGFNSVSSSLGLPGTNSNITRFTQLSIPATIVKYTGINTASAALDSNGNLWSWGSNQQGYQGTGSFNNTLTSPKIIQTDVTNAWVIGRARGNSLLSLVWTDTENRTWGSGNNTHGYMGIVSSGVSYVTIPTIIPFKSPDEYPIHVVSVGVVNDNTNTALFYIATMWLTNKNRIYINGRNENAASIIPISSTYYPQRPMEITNLL